MNTGEPVWIWLALVVAFGLFYPAMYGPIAAFWSELSRRGCATRASSFVYQFSGIFASGLTPLVATALLGARAEGSRGSWPGT